jgi:L-ribulokinase
VNPNDACVVGIDFGSVGSRGAVMNPDDTELGTGVFEYPHAVLERSLPTRGVALPLTGLCKVLSDYVDVLRNAVPDAIRATGIDPGNGIGIGTTAFRPM